MPERPVPPCRRGRGPWSPRRPPAGRACAAMTRSRASSSASRRRASRLPGAPSATRCTCASTSPGSSVPSYDVTATSCGQREVAGLDADDASAVDEHGGAALEEALAVEGEGGLHACTHRSVLAVWPIRQPRRASGSRGIGGVGHARVGWGVRPRTRAREVSGDRRRSRHARTALRHGTRVRLPPSRAAAPDGLQADPVRRRRAQLHRQGLGRAPTGRRALGADVPRRLRGRPAQPGRPDPLRGAQRARLDPRRAHLLRVARHGGRDARAHGDPAVHRRRAPPGRRVRPVRHQLLHRARLHQHAQRPRPRRHPAARGRPRRRRTRS